MLYFVIASVTVVVFLENVTVRYFTKLLDFLSISYHSNLHLLTSYNIKKIRAHTRGCTLRLILSLAYYVGICDLVVVVQSLF